MRILVLSVQTPFTNGGAELLIRELIENLSKLKDTQVDLVNLPFTAIPKEKILNQIAYWRALDLTSFGGQNVDLVISTKFPSYMVKHPNKVCWLVHQHRQAYELYGTRYGDLENSESDNQIKDLIIQADKKTLTECKRIFTISENVSKRLKFYLDIESETLPPPLPRGEIYNNQEKGDYILSVGRLCSIKRQELIIKSLPMINENLKLKLVGQADEPSILQYLKSEVSKHGLENRVEFIEKANDEYLIELFSKCFSVYFAPFDEDYGYVTLEALASRKPVVTTDDSGGVLSFIKNNFNGLVSRSHTKDIANAYNLLFQDQDLYSKLSSNCKIDGLTPDWEEICKKLIS